MRLISVKKAFDCTFSSLPPIAGPEWSEGPGAAQARSIHALEARATVFGLKKASVETIARGRILFSVGDNLSSILAYEKGRARCEDLLAQCRTAAAYLIGAQIRWHHRYIESERNVTDFDSRAAGRGEILRGRTQSVYGSLQSILSKFKARGRGFLQHGVERPSPAAPVPAPLPSETLTSLPPTRKNPDPVARSIVARQLLPQSATRCLRANTHARLLLLPLASNISDLSFPFLFASIHVRSAFALGTSWRSFRAAVDCLAHLSNAVSRSCARLTSRRARGMT